MKYLNKIASVFFVAALGLLTMTSCEGGDLYNIGAPEWLSEMSGGEEDDSNIIPVTPNPSTLGSADNTTAWWTVFTDDYKTEPGKTYQIKFMNYGGASNWNNFVLILRNEAKDFEYAVLRSDNWGWGTGYSGEESDAHFSKKMESSDRDWATWLKAMNMAKCTMNIYNYGDGTADVKITMLGSDGNTYTQEYTGISVDKDDLYFAFTVDNSHIEFGDIDVEDSDPVSMTLSGVPSEVAVGTTLEEVVANVKATVTFESGVTKDVTANELQFEAIPNMEDLGQKTLVVIYNKTYLGENCGKPIVESKIFSVVKELSAFTQTYVVPTPLILGAEDNTSAPWYEFFTNNIKVEPKETKVVSFTNYTAGNNNWDNFLIRLNTANWASYAVVRADNFGWDPGYAACTPSMEPDRVWEEWLPDMNGGKVTAYITNNGDGTADIKIDMVGVSGKAYKQEYIGINTIDPEDMYFNVLVENAHVVFDQVVGATDNSNLWGDQVMSQMVRVSAHQAATFNFTNNSAAVNNWDNFMIVLGNSAGEQQAVCRADNWGWGTSFDSCTKTIEADRNWDEWRAAMDGAKVTVTITNNGDGTADVKAVMVGNNSKTYTQDYTGVTVNNPDDFNVRFSVDACHLVFE